MRILVFPHDLDIGGSQINAIELASAVQDRGHSVVLFGRPGALNARIRDLGLEFLEAPRPRQRPTPAIVHKLMNVVRERNIDVLHGYEWPPALECLLAARGTHAVAVSTVMSMAVAPFIPRQMPLLVGTAEILDAERRRGRNRTALLEPPVDLEHNNPNIDVGTEQFRRRWGLGPECFVVVAVSRLAVELKLEGLLSAIKAAGQLAHDIPIKLLIAGDGAGREQVEAAAAAVNFATGNRTVIVAGGMPDPRPAYAAADVVLGMGSSALRALAFAKPLIVQGEQGFWELLTPQSLPLFLRQGWYGVSSDPQAGLSRLATLLRQLHDGPRRRESLGTFGLRLVSERFSLARAAEQQEDFYRKALDFPARPSLRQDASACGSFLSYQLGRRARRLLGAVATDDFNARPVSSPRATENPLPEVTR